MIKLNKFELSAVSGGEMTCYCLKTGTENEWEVQEVGNSFAGACESSCCGWTTKLFGTEAKLYDAWRYDGPDTELVFLDDGSLVTSKRQAAGKC